MEQLLDKIPVSPGIQTLIGLAIIIFATVLVSVVLRVVVFAAIGRLARRTKTTLDDRLLKASRTNTSLLVYLMGLSVLFDFLGARHPEYLGEGYGGIIDAIIYGLGVIVVAVLIVKVVSALLTWYADTIAVRTETTLDNEFVPLLDRTVKIVVVTLAVLMVLDNFGVDVKGLVAVLGVGSLAVALAAQDTLANMIGGFTIMIDRPFRVGDMVMLTDGRRVIVHEIGIRSTKFLTFDHTLVIVPNAELIKSTVDNVTYPMPPVRIVINVGVSYDSDMQLVRRVMLEEADKNKEILADPEPMFFFQNFGDSSLDVTLRCHVGRAEQHRSASSDLRMQVLERFRAEGIEIPFPQRVVTMVPNSGDHLAEPGVGPTEPGVD